MKNKFRLVLLICIVFSLFLSACGSTETASSSSSKKKDRTSSVSEDVNEKDLSEVVKKIKDRESAKSGKDKVAVEDDLKNDVTEPTYDISFDNKNGLDTYLEYTYFVNDDGSLSFYLTNAQIEFTIPKEWEGKIIVADENSWLSFYHKDTREKFMDKYGFEGGRLFSVSLCEEEPPYSIEKKIGVSGIPYLFCFSTPTDVQGYMEDAALYEEYNDCFEYVDDIISSAKLSDRFAETKKEEKKDNKTSSAGKITDKNVSIKQSDASKVKYEKYTDPSGYFTMEIPKGWKVTTGNDAIHYYLVAYDPKDTDRRIVVQVLVEAFTSNFVNEYYQTYYGYNPGYLVVTDTTTKGFFEALSGKDSVDSHAYYTGFTCIDKLGTLDSGADLIQGICYVDGGNKLEMLCTAYVQVIKDTSGLGLDVVYANGVCMMAAKESEFPDWVPVLDHCVGTLSFTTGFWNERSREWASVQQTAQDVSKKWNSVSDGIMSSWEKRSNSHDIIMQQQSDATLGYDRVVDTETGKVYRAEYGFLDNYSGNRYKAVENGSELYNKPVEGYIQVK